ncbi:MAG: LysM peptidoglycan-binding domain-containing protein [Ilumatobacteraceae bacterium]
MALALHPSNPGFVYRSAPQHRRSHLRLVVSEPAGHRSNPRVSARVYRRRRLVAAIIGLALLAGSILGLVTMFGSSALAEQNLSGRSSTPHVVIAQPGDTLWAIARRIVPVGNITGLVDQLVSMNGDEITAGQEVRLP